MPNNKDVIKSWIPSLLGIVALMGYAMCSHPAFLFAYAVLCWISLALIAAALFLFPLAVKNLDSKDLLKLNSNMVQVVELYHNKWLTWYSLIYSSVSIFLLMYWQAFATATAAIILFIVTYVFKHFMIGMFGKNEQE